MAPDALATASAAGNPDEPFVERRRQAVLGDRRPQLGRPCAALGGFHGRPDRTTSPRSLLAVSSTIVSIAVDHLRPSPLAMMPLRICGVPPRSVHEGELMTASCRSRS